MSEDITRHAYTDNTAGRCYDCTLPEEHSIHVIADEPRDGTEFEIDPEPGISLADYRAAREAEVTYTGTSITITPSPEMRAVVSYAAGMSTARDMHQCDGAALPHLRSDCREDRCGQLAPAAHDALVHEAELAGIAGRPASNWTPRARSTDQHPLFSATQLAADRRAARLASEPLAAMYEQIARDNGGTLAPVQADPFRGIPNADDAERHSFDKKDV
jgi:hypothetical protein